MVWSSDGPSPIRTSRCSSIRICPRRKAPSSVEKELITTRPEVHDDRTVLFAEHLPAGTYQYTYQLVATFACEFRVLPPRAWVFYFPEVYGQGVGRVYTFQPKRDTTAVVFRA